MIINLHFSEVFSVNGKKSLCSLWIRVAASPGPRGPSSSLRTTYDHAGTSGFRPSRWDCAGRVEMPPLRIKVLQTQESIDHPQESGVNSLKPLRWRLASAVSRVECTRHSGLDQGVLTEGKGCLPWRGNQLGLQCFR